MQAKDLIETLSKCNPDDEITFIFDENPTRSWDCGNGLHEVTEVNVTGKKIHGKIALTNGLSSKLLTGTEEEIFTK